MMLAGASAVAMASPVMLRGFELLEDLLREFSDYLSRQNLRAADLIGRAADQRKSFADMPLRTDNWRNYVPKTCRALNVSAFAECSHEAREARSRVAPPSDCARTAGKRRLGPSDDDGSAYATFSSACGAAMFNSPAALRLIIVRISASENCRSSSCRTIER